MKKKSFKERAPKPALSFESTRFRSDETLDVRIEKLVWGGAGLARTDRGVVFVDFAAPGDLARVQVTHTEKDYARARILEILEPSIERTAARCPVFGRCGGCDWQHLQQSRQSFHKQNLLAEAFRRHLDYQQDISWIESPKIWNYRNRIQIHLDTVGPYYHAKRSHLPVHIEDCPIADPNINEQLKKLSPLKPGQPSQRLQLSKDNAPVEDIEGPLSFEFSQVNTEQNLNLVGKVLEWSEGLNFQRFFDLYSGSGNFSFPISEKYPQKRGTAVELNPQSVKSAQAEVLRRKWSKQRLEVFAASVDAILPRLPIDESSLVLLDPPRAGLSKSVTEILSKTKAAGIIYVSCDPPGLVRDLKRILLGQRWKIHRVTAFDMFPQTAHLEVLTELRPD